MSGNGTSLGTNHFTTCADVICGLKVATICSISTLTTLGNLVSLITLGLTPSLLNCHGLLLWSLSIADFVTGLVAGMSVYPSVYNMWPFGETVCLVTGCIEAIAKKASLLTMTSLSIERYVAVTRPLRYNRIVTKPKILVGLAFCWFIPILFYITLFLTRQISNNYIFLLHSCTITYQTQLLSLVLNVVVFILPSLVTVSFTSVKVWMEMKKNVRSRAHMISRLAKQQGRQRSKMAKLFRMLHIMVFTFYACWAPITIVGVACVLADVRQPLGVFFALYWLQFSNSLWNVVIYFAMNDAFRRRAREIFLSPIVALRLCRDKLNHR